MIAHQYRTYPYCAKDVSQNHNDFKLGIVNGRNFVEENQRTVQLQKFFSKVVQGHPTIRVGIENDAVQQEAKGTRKTGKMRGGLDDTVGPKPWGEAEIRRCLVAKVHYRSTQRSPYVNVRFVKRLHTAIK